MTLTDIAGQPLYVGAYVAVADDSAQLHVGRVTAITDDSVRIERDSGPRLRLLYSHGAAARSILWLDPVYARSYTEKR